MTLSAPFASIDSSRKRAEETRRRDEESERERTCSCRIIFSMRVRSFCKSRLRSSRSRFIKSSSVCRRTRSCSNDLITSSDLKRSCINVLSSVLDVSERARVAYQHRARSMDALREGSTATYLVSRFVRLWTCTDRSLPSAVVRVSSFDW